MRPTFPKGIKHKIRQIVRVNLAGEFAAKEIYERQLFELASYNDAIKMQSYNFSHLVQEPDIHHAQLEKIQDMLDQELKHFEYFKHISKSLNISPSLMMSIWKHMSKFIAKYSLDISNLENTFIHDYNIKAQHFFQKDFSRSFFQSFFTGAMKATESIEKVIIEHYKNQLNYLRSMKKLMHSNSNRELEQIFFVIKELEIHIEKFLADELEHFEVARDEINDSHNQSLNSINNHALANKAWSRKAKSVFYKFIEVGCRIAISISNKI